MTRNIALVTGGGTGIGRAVALALAGAGFDLMLAGRRLAPLEDAASEIETAGARARVCACDVGDPDAVAALFDSVAAEFGRLDLLFNNAGMGGPPVLLEDLPFEAWQQVVDVNLTGVFLCAQAAFRLMKAQTPQGGRIINNGSISAHTPRPNSIAYTATKHGVTGITKAAALDGRKYNIAVGQIDIGNADSQMADKMKKGALQPDGSVRPEATMALEHVGRAVVAVSYTHLTLPTIYSV